MLQIYDKKFRNNIYRIALFMHLRLTYLLHSPSLHTQADNIIGAVHQKHIDIQNKNNYAPS